MKEKKKRLAKKNLQVNARNSLLDFICYLHPNYQVNWHHIAICDRLTKLKDERGKKLMIFLGPQRGKSEIVSRYFPAWWLGHFPGSKNILSSYSGDLANSFNRDSQAIITDPRFKEIFPELITGKDSNALKATQNELQTSRRGYLFSVGVEGSTTGRSAGEITGGLESIYPGLFICDDPIKDLADAFSANSRMKKMN